MLVPAPKPLFAWDCLEDNPDLVTIRRLFEALPDQTLLEGLRSWRGRGRNDYPVQVLWRVVVLTIVLRHREVAACLGERRRNPSLQQLIGMESPAQLPKDWNVSRFLDVLGREPHRSRLQALFNAMVERLGVAVPDLGTHTAGDATALSARRLRRDAARHRAEQQAAARSSAPAEGVSARAAEAQVAVEAESSSAKDERAGGNAPAGAKIERDAEGLPQPAGGRKEYTDEQGQVTRVVEWSGYKLHLLVDTRHEVVLAYRISSTKTGDNERLPELVDQGQANLPAGRIRTLAYDKAADDGKVHEKRYAAGIQAVIENRTLWKDELERLLPGHDGTSNIVYDEAGTLYCYDRVSAPMVRHRMAYIGHEPARGTLKYRCPARHEGWSCPLSAQCNADKTYGLTVRVKQEIDLRRFPSIPRATKQFERLYKGRTSVERVIGRLKIFWGADDGNVTGAVRFHAWVGTLLVVHAAFATVLASLPRREGTLGKLRLSPMAQAIEDQRRGVQRETKPRTRKKRPPRGERQPRLFG
jgi:hypothetical protein